MTALQHPGPRPGRGLRIAGIVLMVLAVVLGIGVIAAAFSPLLGDPPTTVAGSATIQADGGDELAVYRTGFGSPEGGCRAVGPDGAELALERPFGNETLTLNGVEYVVDRVFTARSSGAQTVTCTSAGYAVGPRIGVFGLVGAVLGGVFGGIAMFILGLVLLIVGLSRRKSSAQPPYPGQQPPFGGQPPYPGQQPPYPGQQPPFGGQPPYLGQQPPYPGQQPPYPGQQPPFQG